jgi:sugar transferase (PEP-CTERM system associated)
MDLVQEFGVHEVVVAVRERRGGVLSLRQLLDCKLAGVRVLDLSTYYERSLGQVRLDSLRASWLIFGEGFRQGLLRSFVKRSFDIVAALLLLLLTWPMMLVTAALIRIEDGGPVFYGQERVGQGGRTFRVIKFRSMRNDAERDGKPRWASSNDDRITAIGRVIRKLRIDELPQIINVLKGDMSLVGPRPERPYFVDQLIQEIPFYAARHSVKPGVTGWAQVRYHYGASVDDAVHKLQYDLYYVKNHSLFLDVLVLFQTVGVVLTGKGAQ